MKKKWSDFVKVTQLHWVPIPVGTSCYKVMQDAAGEQRKGHSEVQECCLEEGASELKG